MLKNKKSSFLKTFINNNYRIGTGSGVVMFQNIGLNTRIQPNVLKRKQVNEISKKTQKIICGKKLKDQVKSSVNFLLKNKTYKGIRHKLKYPARGQRTHTNAKTKKKFKY